MRAPPLALLLVAFSAAAQGDPNPCRTACLRTVQHPALVATACGQCIFSPDDRGAWVSKLAQVPVEALGDPDWQVRWAVLRVQAERAKASADKRLAHWVAGARGLERDRACLTALHVAGSRTLTLAGMLSNSELAEPAAPRACAALVPKLREELELDLYAANPTHALEALTHLANALSLSTARVALDAMKSRPASTDHIIAGLLLLYADGGGPPVGYSLLREASGADTAQMDRLLALFSQLRDKNRPLLASHDKEVRRQGLAALAAIAPLSKSELVGELADESTALQMKAAVAIARGEGRTFVEAARTRLDGSTPAPVAERRVWLALLAEVRDPGCAGVTRALWHDTSQPEAVRSQALVSLAGCTQAEALDDLEAAFGSETVALRVGAVRGAGMLPREVRAAALVEKGLAAADTEVLEASIAGAEAHRLRKVSPQLIALCGHSAPTIRVAAIRALTQLDGPKLEPLAARCLSSEGDAAVRVVCAEALGVVGSPKSIMALRNAVQSDADVHVKFVAGESLRKLGER